MSRSGNVGDLEGPSLSGDSNLFEGGGTPVAPWSSTLTVARQQACASAATGSAALTEYGQWQWQWFNWPLGLKSLVFGPSGPYDAVNHVEMPSTVVHVSVLYPGLDMPKRLRPRIQVCGTVW